MWPLDIQKNHMNFNALRPTDLPFNKRVIMPPNLKMKNLISKEENGVRPIHRPRSWKEKKPKIERREKKTN